LKDPIRRFKYNQKTYLRKPFAQFMMAFVQTYHLDIEQFDIIVPVPLFPSRLRERGYNQSRLLAEPIAQKYHIDLSLKNLVRVRNTRHQTLLSEKERWTNIHGAFRIKHSAEFSGKNILIVDDLLTTGATASEAARTLKGAGAETVGVLTLAITH
jgi:competence protein ComFC